LFLRALCFLKLLLFKIFFIDIWQIHVLGENKHIYLWRKVVCFVLYLWDPPNQDIWDCVLGVFGKLLTRRDPWAWFHDIWTCGATVLENWIIFSLKIKLNLCWKFHMNWNVPLVFLERSWWAGFDGSYLVRFGFRV